MVEPHQHVIFIVAIAVAAIGAWLDWRKGEIPNWLTLPAILVAPLLHIARYQAVKETMETSLYEGAYSFGGAALCAVVPLLLFRQSAIGGGDVKLLVALGALLQPVLGVEAQMYGFFAGAILAPARLAMKGSSSRPFATRSRSCRTSFFRRHASEASIRQRSRGFAWGPPSSSASRSPSICTGNTGLIPGLQGNHAPSSF